MHNLSFWVNFVFFCFLGDFWELRNIYHHHHHHPGSKKRKSSEANSGSIHPYGRYGTSVKTRKAISTIAILWPVKAIFEKRAATVEVDTLISPGFFRGNIIYAPFPSHHFWLKGIFQGRGVGCIFWGPTRQEFYTPPPPLKHPPPLEGYFQGWGGWGCIKFGPVFFFLVFSGFRNFGLCASPGRS